MTAPIQAGYAGRQVIHTEDADRLYRGTDSGFQIVDLVISPPNADRALVITGILVSNANPQGDCCQIRLYDGAELLQQWRVPMCGAVPMEFVHGIRCSPGNDARLTAACDGANLWVNMKCRLE